ncbi:MAG TPA: hypothetical protein VF808_08225 [Ktedonobacterales bacterium]
MGRTHGAKTDQKLRWDACKRYEHRLLPGEAAHGAPDDEIEARGVTLAAALDAFREARANLDARTLVGREASRGSDA